VFHGYCYNCWHAVSNRRVVFRELYFLNIWFVIGEQDACVNCQPLSAMADSEHIDPEVECADDQVVSMVDVLNDEQQLQEDATAVLGACDDNICTYSQVGAFVQFVSVCLAIKNLPLQQ